MAIISFTVNIAGIPIELRSRFQDNKEFFQEYITDEEPILSIDAADNELADLRETQEIFVKCGKRKNRRTDVELESVCFHKKISDYLLDHQILLLHGSTVCLDGEAYIFTAPPGTGKSTHATLWLQVFGERAYILNDDMPYLRICDDEIRVYGTPWMGKHRRGRKAMAPLKTIILLNRDEKNHIKALTKQAAFQVLLQQAYGTNNKAIMEKVFLLEKRLVNQIPFFMLGCNMEKEAALVAWQGANSLGNP